MSRTSKRVGTKTKVNPHQAGIKKPPKFKYPPRTRYHRRGVKYVYPKREEESE